MTTWVSRHDWGARQPRHRPDLPRHPKGVACHYTGPPLGLTDGCDDGRRCAEQVRAIQRYHMDEHDWADIASNFEVCLSECNDRWSFHAASAGGQVVGLARCARW